MFLERLCFSIELGNRIAKIDVTFQVTNLKIVIEILLLSY